MVCKLMDCDDTPMDYEDGKEAIETSDTIEAHGVLQGPLKAILGPPGLPGLPGSWPPWVLLWPSCRPWLLLSALLTFPHGLLASLARPWALLASRLLLGPSWALTSKALQVIKGLIRPLRALYKP